MPAPTLRASTVQAINDNIIEATLVPEFFGPALHVHGETIPLPNSPVDGYVYTRSELFYHWSLNDTGPASEIRLSLFAPSINPTTGVVTINTWRMRPGGPIQLFHDGSIRVTTVGFRQAAVPNVPTIFDQPPSDVGTLGGDFGPYDLAIGFGGLMTLANQDLTPPFIPPRPLNFLYAGSARSVSPAAGNTIISLRRNGTEWATITFAGGSTVGTFSPSGITFGGHISNLGPEGPSTFDGLTDVLSVVGPATPDTTLADIGIVLSAKRAF